MAGKRPTIARNSSSCSLASSALSLAIYTSLPNFLTCSDIFGTSYDRFTAVIVGFVINYAAYFAEIYRGGIQSIPIGQYEASLVLGFSKAHTFTHIVAPQVVKRIIPAMGNEVITLVKDTALAQTIVVAELFRVAQNAAARQFSTMPIFIAGVFYFIMNALVSRSFDLLEKKLNYYH